MKKKFAILNLSLMTAVLFAMLFQSFHSVEHIAETFSEVQCHHNYDTAKHQITHQHHNFDHCFVCDFGFSGFITPETFSYSFNGSYKSIPYFFTTSETPHSFSGSSYSLRGPPDFIA